MDDIRIEDSWKTVLADEFLKPYFIELCEFVRREYLTKTIFPRPADIFAAFRETPWDSVRVVILGQDPYHGDDQAMGLAFSVREGVDAPPSLKNIFKEVNSEQSAVNSLHAVGPSYSMQSTDLTRWAGQGVLLLNSVLTVEKGKVGSHARQKTTGNSGGWEEFTDSVIQKISNEKEGVVFVLWGNYARKKKALVDTTKHLVLEAPHPSPLSAHSGFFGCGHFTKVNEWLRARGEKEVEW